MTKETPRDIVPCSRRETKRSRVCIVLRDDVQRHDGDDGERMWRPTERLEGYLEFATATEVFDISVNFEGSSAPSIAEWKVPDARLMQEQRQFGYLEEILRVPTSYP